MGDEVDRVAARISELRAFVAGLNIDELLPIMTEDELRALLSVLERIKRNRERGGPTLN